ncbi:MAG: glutamate racemase [Cryomorphaceae bacterium]|jgi:glutamate racemase
MSRIVIYDSGVGGLSIYKEVLQQCPDFDYVFVSDNEFFPYGTKSAQQLTQRVVSVCNAIQRNYSPDLMVVACNTASTAVLPILRDKFDFPIVGVVPAIKPAAVQSVSKTIGLLATPATIIRPYTNELIRQHAANCELIKLGSSELVEMAEAKLRGKPIEITRLKAILQPLLQKQCLDVVVLACTHFPLLRDELVQVLGDKVSLMDSGAAIASRVKQLSSDLTPCLSHSAAVFTQKLTDQHFADRLRDFGFGEIETLSI